MNIEKPTLFDDILGTPVPTLHRAGEEQRAALETARVAGTYIREGDGACLLLYSPVHWRDANYAITREGGRRGDFRVIRPGDPAYREEMESLSPGEYEEVF